MNNRLDNFFDNYEQYRNKEIKSQFIPYSLLSKLIQKIKGQSAVNVSEIGKSFLGRSIHSITLGSGNTKILAWSQMHGDEPTATAAIFDIINFLLMESSNQEVKNIFNNLTICFIPMLNPDGAEQFRRQNEQKIDINRDALRKATPESKIFWKLVEKFKPAFAFNLHDQNSYYTAGRTDKSSAISLLSPPANFEKEADQVRISGMKVILEIQSALNRFIPGQTARYSDDFEPRAFGDNLTKMGVSSILIESGYCFGDENKDFVRKLNFISILTALNSIAAEEYKKSDECLYYSIPENQQNLFDLLLRNCIVQTNGNNYTADIGIIRGKKYESRNQTFYYVSKIKEIGDLSIFYGIEEIDLSGYTISPLNLLAEKFSADTINQLDFSSYIMNGYGYAYIKRESSMPAYFKAPFNFVMEQIPFSPKLDIDEYANLIIRKNDVISAVVLNGFYVKIGDHSKLNDELIKNGVIIS